MMTFRVVVNGVSDDSFAFPTPREAILAAYGAWSEDNTRDVRIYANDGTDDWLHGRIKANGDYQSFAKE